MAVAQTVPSLPGSGSKRTDWHKRRILLTVVIAASMTALLAVYGLDYYTLDGAHRISSWKHSQLKPSGSIGHPLGIVGGVLFLLIFLYPIRKRWPWLARRGKTKNWLDFHILMGLVAPAIITFHSSFKLQGIAGLAYWIMMSVVLSGIAGRYLYSQIPRRLDAAEMSLQEIQSVSEQLSEQLASQNVLRSEDTAPLFRLPSFREVDSLPLSRALMMMVTLDVSRGLMMWRLKRKVRLRAADDREFEEIISVMKKQVALSKKILFLSRAQQVFHLWHVVHRPFSYSFAILSVLHVLIVLLLGYF